MILAFLYRLRGKHQDEVGTTEARLALWVMPLFALFILVAAAYHYPFSASALAGLLVWAGITMGHSFCQNNAPRSYVEMGLVCATRLLMAFIPFLFGPPQCSIFFYLPLVFFFLTWGVSALSYSTFFQSKTLHLFGVNWCTPGDSSWEEWLIGLCYDIAFIVLFVWGFAHV